jgi:RNA-binding protein YlmH
VRTDDPDALLGAARAGRVAHSGFLPPAEAARLAAALRQGGANVQLAGGVIGARRRVVVAFPEHVPAASVALAACYYAGVHDEEALVGALLAAGLEPADLGDVIRHADGLSVIVMADAESKARTVGYVGDVPVAPERVPLERLAGGRARRQQVVVPSLRVDALGAKAFRVSRSYFSKGIAGGKVSVDGRKVGKSASAEAGSEVNAEGLGRFTLVSVQGETRRGNLKVVLEVEEG